MVRSHQRIAPQRLGLALWLATVALSACHGGRPSGLGLSGAHLAPCPTSPNCVSSEEGEGARRVMPLVLAVPPDQGWPAVAKAVAELQGARVVEQSDTYLHAECRSRLFGFVDDLELHLQPNQGVVAVRSASRVGYWDFGANRRRVKGLRSRLEREGIVQ